MIAVIYARVSTSAGKQDTERQVKELTEFAKEYNIEIAKFFHDHHLNVYFKRENLNMFNNDGSENTLFTMLFAMFSKFAENERTAIKERLQSGYKNFRDKGGKVGRKEGSVKTKEQLEQEYKHVIKELKAGLSIVKVAKLCDVAPGTVAKIKRIFSINYTTKKKQEG